MALLTNRDAILGAAKLKTEEFFVPEWDGTVLLRELTGKQRDDFEASQIARIGDQIKPNLSNLRARLVALCIVNERGELVFNPKDLRDLGEMPASGLDRVFSKCQEMNALSGSSVEEEAEVFEHDPSESSTSD